MGYERGFADGWRGHSPDVCCGVDPDACICGYQQGWQDGHDARSRGRMEGAR